MNYLEVLSQAFPDVEAYSTGTLYSDIQWTKGGPISQAALEAAHLEVVKTNVKSAITEYREWLKGQGMWFQGHFFDTADTARQNITATVAACSAGLTLPVGFTWRDFNNNDVPANNQFMAYLGISLMAYISSLYTFSWALKSQVDSMTDLNSIMTFDYVNQAWPSANYDGSKPVGA